MRKLLLGLQIFGCCSLAAEDIASSGMQRNKSDKCQRSGFSKEEPALFSRGDEPLEGMPMAMHGQSAAAYAYPATTQVTGSCDIYGTASYIYWYIGEDGLELATPVIYDSGTLAFPAKQNGQVVFQDQKYSSGFKLGVGANLYVDDWAVEAEYTYLRKTTHTSASLPDAGAPAGFTSAYKFNNWFAANESGYGVVGTNFSSKWRFSLDWLDLSIKRPFYQGRRLIVTPSAGLRVSWIRQRLELTAPDAALAASGTTFNDFSKTDSYCWGVGPRTVLGAQWLVAGGFRFLGSFGGSLLFTQFTEVVHSESGAISSGTTYPVASRISDYNCLRPMMEGNVGVGWGMYFYDLAYHVDLSATYDFNYLWGQNMMRKLVDLNSMAGTGSAQDAYLNGLTVKARFDF